VLTIKAVECKECGDTIYSRTHHDFRQCTCGNISVDGGLKYFKYNANPSSLFKVKKVQVDATINELYEDYNSMEDRFGLITPSSNPEEPVVVLRR